MLAMTYTGIQAAPARLENIVAGTVINRVGGFLDTPWARTCVGGKIPLWKYLLVVTQCTYM